MSDWRPSASLAVLEARAALLAKARAFFYRAGVLEVDVPVLGEAGVTDLHIDNIEARVLGRPAYLQSSPEFYMKRLLAAGAGAIFYLGKAFRDGERGARHNPEFTMLEWYRPGWDEHRLMAEVEALFHDLGAATGASQAFTYRQVFQSATGLDPHSAPVAELRRLAGEVAGSDWSGEDRGTCLDLLFGLRVEPSLPDGLVFVYDYPECQSALARLTEDDNGQTVARRFEVFLDRLELGNGYFELTDADSQRQRFREDRERRREQGKVDRQADENLLDAMAHGLPPCAGVAIGFDRLLMKIEGIDDIGRVLPFR